MNVGKRERSFLIVLLMALVGLLVDKFLLPPPAAATAQEPALEEPPARSVEPPGSPATLSAPSPAAVPDGRAPNVFAWTRLGTEIVEPLKPEKSAAEAVLQAEEFTRRHVLQATVLGPRPVACVGQRTLRIGDRLDGFRLETISGREAVFVSDNGQRVALRVAEGPHKD